MYRYLILLTLLFNEINCDCLYPKWKETCQKYCMSNQLYEIQLNQCYSMNPNQLTCKCSGKDLTEKIKNIIQNNHSKAPSTVHTTLPENITCIPSHSCSIGKNICNGLNAYCTCDNGTWVNILCPKGNVCQTQDTIGSCQMVLSNDEHMSLFSMSNSASSMKLNNYFHMFIFCLFIIKKK